MSHEDLVETAEEAIESVFADTTVPPTTVRDSLKSLLDLIKAKLETLGDLDAQFHEGDEEEEE